MKPINIGLLGLGHVGAATVDVLQKNALEISRRAGRSIQVTCAAVRDLKKPRLCALSHLELTDDPYAVVNNPDVDVVVELLGGTEPAQSLIMDAIAQGKHIVTANKALIALHGNEIFKAAHERKLNVAFEAAVAGGIPIIKAIREGLAGNCIEGLAGILNGTSNYILTEMLENGSNFSDVLFDAQAQGYAEADPTFDIEGIDVAHKLTILAAIAFGIPLQFDKVYREGISHITPEDLIYAKALGYRVKHLGIAEKRDEGVELRVHPTLVQEKKLLANINGVMNGVMVEADTVGETIYYGPGAGGSATASAVVADIVDVVRVLTVDPENRVPHLAFQADALANYPIIPISDVQTANYLRVNVEDHPGVLAAIADILARFEISIEALIQKEPKPDTQYLPIVILTKPVSDHAMTQALIEIEALSSTEGKVTRIRMGD